MTTTNEQIAKGQGFLAQGGEIIQLLLKKLSLHCVKNGNVNNELLDHFQVEAYRLAVQYCQWEAAKEMANYAALGELERALGLGYMGWALNSMREQLPSIALQLEVDNVQLGGFITNSALNGFLRETTSAKFMQMVLNLMQKFNSDGNYNLSEDHRLMQEMFRNFAETKVRPIAEELHRKDLLIPESIINGVRELDCFGLSIPAEYGGFQEHPDNIGIVVVTEELSRGALIVGSLITRPDILSKAILKGGTDEQKQRWLPKLASGEKLCAVAVTEPNFGSNVAGISVTAKEVEGGWVLNGVKTWCTFAGRADWLLVLARTEPDPSLKHKGLSILVAEKPIFTGHDFDYTQPDKGGQISGRAISTIGYRGMHSYEVSFENYFVPAQNLIGLQEGRGKGFYMQMAGFSGGRLQTSARAMGVMQAAFETAKQYAKDRQVFDQPLVNFGLTQTKIAQMAMIIQACRQLTYKAANLMNQDKGQTEATMVKFMASRMAEWVTREALQIHGGMGYAEEYSVSRYFQDARVLSIFEGAEEVLALRVLMPALLK